MPIPCNINDGKISVGRASGTHEPKPKPKPKPESKADRKKRKSREPKQVETLCVADVVPTKPLLKKLGGVARAARVLDALAMVQIEGVPNEATS